MSEAFAGNAPKFLIETLPTLDERSLKLFPEVMQELYRHCYVLKVGAVKVNPKYAFLDKNEDLVQAYLNLGGWRLSLDRERGIARLYHSEGSGRVHFNKDETMILLILRLMYHERLKSVSESPDVTIRVGDLREKIHSLLPANLVRPLIGKKILSRSFRKFEQFRILLVTRSQSGLSEETLITLTPVIESVVSGQSIDESKEKLKSLFQAETEEVENPL